jgi:uncharacterized protein (TIGR02145 family)
MQWTTVCFIPQRPGMHVGGYLIGVQPKKPGSAAVHGCKKRPRTCSGTGRNATFIAPKEPIESPVMLRTLLSLTLLSCLLHGQAQVIELTFTGQYQGDPVSLDSVFVVNLSQAGDTMLFYPDTVLVLGTTGIAAWDAADRDGFTLGPSHPNPYSDHTNVDLNVYEAGVLRMGVSDALGREVASYQGAVAPGTHRFQLRGGQPGVQVVWVELNGQRRSIRTVVVGEGLAGAVRLEGLGADPLVVATKDSRALFTWMPGDELQMTGYATLPGGQAASGWISEVPTVSTDHVIQLANGLVCADSPSVTDIDGNVYPVVSIGGQCWMAENLRTTRYRDGAEIPNVTDATAWSDLETGAWSNYDNDTVNDALYGKLYNWFAAFDVRICPQGWHVPTDADWQTLELALGMLPAELAATDWRGTTPNVGGQLKSLSLWITPNNGATNSSGFAALPGGNRDNDNGSFNDLPYYGYWWSTTESSTDKAWCRYLQNNKTGIGRFGFDQKLGFCLRCVLD